MCLDPDTGKVVWEYKINLFQSDAPAHRVGWASPAIDPETGNVYAQTVAGMVVALSKEGKLLWERSLAEEWGAFTTHGWPYDVAAGGWRPGDRQPRGFELGFQWSSIASLHCDEQEDRRDAVGFDPGRASVRHGVRAADHRDY
jgi:hypothetical protein